MDEAVMPQTLAERGAVWRVAPLELRSLPEDVLVVGDSGFGKATTSA